MTLQWKPLILDDTAARLANLDKHRYAKQVVETNTLVKPTLRVLK